MKKLFKVVIILLAAISAIPLFIGFYVSFVPQVKDLTVQSEAVAVNILKEYLQEDTKFTELNPQNIYAYEIDLNSDGGNEIIGYVRERYYCIDESCTLFVLQKQSEKFVNIAMMRVNYKSKMVVKRSMTNGYRDIEFKFEEGKHIVRYQNGWYRWVYILPMFKDLVPKKGILDTLFN